MKKIMVNIVFYTFALLSFCTRVFATVELNSTVINTLTDVTKILLLIGAGVCIAKVIHIGILFVTSSAADKSNAKMAILPWLIGTFVCFGAATIGSYFINLIKVDQNVLEY